MQTHQRAWFLATASLAKTFSAARVRAGCPRFLGAMALAAGLLAAAPALWSQPAMTVTPSSVSVASTGAVELAITGIPTSGTVRIERFLDTGGDGFVDSYDPLVQSFLVTDGFVVSYAGTRDVNVPGDDDGAADGAIDTQFNLRQCAELARGVGPYLFRVSSPSAAFTTFTVPFAITQAADGQSISGTVTSGGSPVPYPLVGLLSGPDGEYYRGVLGDGSGNYTINAPAGTYQVMPIADGQVTDFDTLPTVTLAAGVNETAVDLTLTPVTNSIAGRLADAGTSAGIPGVQIVFESLTGKFALTFTKANGTYVRGVTADQWKVDVSELSLPPLGYLRPSVEINADTRSANVTGLDVALVPASALIYGTVSNYAMTPIAGLRMYAHDSGHNYELETVTDATGYYTLGVTAGDWYVGIPTDSNPALSGYIPPTSAIRTLMAGQAANTSFYLGTVTAHLQGTVQKDGGVINWGPTGLRIMAFNNSGQMISGTTAPDGSFDLGVSAGTWTISIEGMSAADNGVIGPQVSATVSDGQTLAGITVPALSAGQQITGTVTYSGSPVVGAHPYARAMINTLPYNASGQTGADGSYLLTVPNGTWMVGVTDSGYINPLEQQVVVADGPQTANFTLGTTPIITSHPVDQTVNENQSASFSVYTTGGGSISYAWQVSTDGGSIWTNITGMMGPYSAFMAQMLWVLPPAGYNGYQYRCIVYNGGTDGPSATSNAALLTVNGGGGAVAPSVTQHPGNQSVTEGSPAIFSAAFSGSPTPSLQWQVSADNGSTWNDVPANYPYSGSTSASLNVITTLGMNGQQFRCRATNTGGSAETNGALLTVSPGGTPTVSQVIVGKTQLFSQTGAATVVPHLTAPWLLNVMVEGTSLGTLTAPTFLAPATSGISGGTLAFDGNRWNAMYPFTGQAALDAAFKSGQYDLTVNATSIALSLTGDAYPVAPVVTASVGSWSDNQLHVVPADALQLTTNVFTGYAAPTYLAGHISVHVRGAMYYREAESSSTVNPATTSLTLSIPAYDLIAGQVYEVEAAFNGMVDAKTTLGNDAAVYSSVTRFQLVVDGPPTIVSQPASQNVTAGQGAAFSVTATGIPSPSSYQWQVSSDSGVSWSNLTNDATYSGVATSSLNLSSTTVAISRNLYRCVVGNAYGTTPTNAAFLRVAPATVGFAGTDDFIGAGNWSAPNILNGAAFLNVANDRMEYQVVMASGDDAVLREWTPNVGSYNQDWSVQVDVHLAGLTLTDGQYANLNLIVYDAADALMPMNQIDRINVAIDRYGTASSTVSDFASDFRGNGVRVPVDGQVEIPNPSTDATLRISFDSATKTISTWYDADGAANDYVWTQIQSFAIGEGTYSWGMNSGSTFAVALVGGSGGVNLSAGQAWFDNFQATTPVSGTPFITVEPASQNVVAGQNATFSLTATGDPTPSYQWSASTDGGANWTPLTDNATFSGSATASLTVNAVTAAMSRTLFNCVVTNTAGIDVSAVAVLRVEPAGVSFAGSDLFGSADNWSLPNRPAFGSGNLIAANGRLEFSVGTPTDDDAVMREWLPNVGSYTQDWAVQVDVHLDAFSLSGDQYANLNLVVFNAAEALGQFEAIDHMTVAIDRYFNGTSTVRGIEGDLVGNGNRDPVSGMMVAPTESTDAALRISFNSTTKTLTSWYDADGAANGYTWTMLQSIPIGTGAFTWAMNESGRFAVALVGGARHLSLSGSQAWFDNFHAAAPRITTQPAGQVVPTGGSATLSVVAAGNGPFTFQWSKNGVNLDGATGASYNLANFQASDAGTYRVVVTDAEGVSIASNNAGLTERKVVTVFDISGVAGLRGMSSAFDGTNYLVAIQGYGATVDAITAQLMSAAGAQVGTRIQLGQNGGMPLVAFDGTNYLIVWAGASSVYGQLVSPAGTLVGSAFTVSPRTATNGSVFLQRAGANTLVAWSTDNVIYGQWVSPAGALVGSELTLSGATSYARDLGLGYNGTDVLVAWSGGGAYRPIVYGQLLNPGTGLVGGTFTIDADVEPSDNPIVVASDGSSFLVVYPDQYGSAGAINLWNLYGRIVSGSGATGSAFLINGNPGPLIAMRLAFDGTNYLLSFSNLNATSPGCIFRFIDTAGQKLGPAGFALFPVQDSVSPAVAAPMYANGKYFIPATYGTWTGVEGDPLVGVRIYGAFLDPSVATDGTRSTQTITFAALADIPFTATPLTLSATATSGLTVTFNATGPALVTGNQLTLTGTGLVTVTASQIGDASFLSAPDVQRSFTVTPNFYSWQLVNFTPEEIALPGVSGPNAVFGQDGLPNLVKYALGLDPKVNATSGLPQVSTDATYWLFTYTRPADRADVTYEVQYSTNLSTGIWTPLVSGVDHVRLSEISGIQTWQAKYPLASAANLFFRLQVSR